MEETTIPTVDSEISEQPQVEGDTQVEATDSQEQPVVETPTEEGQEGESFFDPNQVPEELKPAYKQMQSAFTKKTQEIAETRKQAEELQAKADQYAKYEQYIPVIEEMLQANQASTQTPELAALEQDLRSQGYSDDAIEMMKVGVNFTLKQINQAQTQQAEQAQQAAEVERLNQGIDKAASLDPRLTDKSLVYQVGDKSQTFGEVVEKFVMANPDWKSDPIKATQEAIATVDALLSTAKTEGKKELSASARQKATTFPNITSSPQGTAQTDRVMSVQDAFKEAKAELGL